VYLCAVWISEQTAIISPYSINWLVFITETQCVYCAVRTECIELIFDWIFKRVNIPMSLMQSIFGAKKNLNIKYLIPFVGLHSRPLYSDEVQAQKACAIEFVTVHSTLRLVSRPSKDQIFSSGRCYRNKTTAPRPADMRPVSRTAANFTTQQADRPHRKTCWKTRSCGEFKELKSTTCPCSTCL
jgi:hypothetical protein